MNIYTLSVLCSGMGDYSSPIIVFCPPWLPDMGFTLGALVQVLPEAGGMSFTLCDENIQKYSELLLTTEEKKGTLVTVDRCRTGVRIEIEGRYIRNAGLDIGDTLVALYDYGLIRVRKMSKQLDYRKMKAEF